MNTNAIFIFVYAIIVIAGGVMGYIIAGSIPSLVMGSAVGALLLLCGWAVQQQSETAFYAAIGLASLLTLFFMYRLYLTGKFMPAGIMVLLSVGLIILLLKLRN